jgi:hypothetical protein
VAKTIQSGNEAVGSILTIPIEPQISPPEDSKSQTNSSKGKKP